MARTKDLSKYPSWFFALINKVFSTQQPINHHIAPDDLGRRKAWTLAHQFNYFCILLKEQNHPSYFQAKHISCSQPRLSPSGWYLVFSFAANQFPPPPELANWSPAEIGNSLPQKTPSEKDIRERIGLPEPTTPLIPQEDPQEAALKKLGFFTSKKSDSNG